MSRIKIAIYVASSNRDHTIASTSSLHYSRYRILESHNGDPMSSSSPSTIKKVGAVLGITLLALILLVLGVGFLVGLIGQLNENAQGVKKVTPAKTVPSKTENTLLSEDQQKIIDTFGPPPRFKLAYLPFGDDELARIEMWFYSQHGQLITFVAGHPYKVSKINESHEQTEYSDYLPQDFDFSMNYEQTVEALDAKKIEPVDFANDVFAEDGVKTYVADKVIFTIEQGHLTYMETMGVVR